MESGGTEGFVTCCGTTFLFWVKELSNTRHKHHVDCTRRIVNQHRTGMFSYCALKGILKISEHLWTVPERSVHLNQLICPIIHHDCALYYLVYPPTSVYSPTLYPPLSVYASESKEKYDYLHFICHHHYHQRMEDQRVYPSCTCKT